MRWFGFMLAFLVMALASVVPTPFIFVSAWLIVSVPSRSVPAIRIMCWNSRLVVVDMFVLYRLVMLIGYQVKDGFFI